MNTTKPNVRTSLIVILVVALLAAAGWAVYASMSQPKANDTRNATETNKATEQPKAADSTESKTSDVPAVKTAGPTLKVGEFGIELPLGDNPYQLAYEEDEYSGHIITSKTLTAKCDADSANQGHVGYIGTQKERLAAQASAPKAIASATVKGVVYELWDLQAEGCSENAAVHAHRTEAQNWLKKQFTQLRAV